MRRSSAEGHRPLRELRRRAPDTALLLTIGLFAAAGAPDSRADTDVPTPTGRFLTVAAETMDGAAFSFPGDLRGAPLLLGIAISTSRANGEYQQGVLLEWQAWLDAADALPEAAAIYHFPVIESPPRFIRGAIRRAMRRTFADKVPEDRAAMLFVDDPAAFAAAAGLTIDEEPTLVLADGDARPLWLLKGGPDPGNTAALLRALQALAAAAETDDALQEPPDD